MDLKERFRFCLMDYFVESIRKQFNVKKNKKWVEMLCKN